MWTAYALLGRNITWLVMIWAMGTCILILWSVYLAQHECIFRLTKEFPVTCSYWVNSCSSIFSSLGFDRVRWVPLGFVRCLFSLFFFLVFLFLHWFFFSFLFSFGFWPVLFITFSIFTDFSSFVCFQWFSLFLGFLYFIWVSFVYLSPSIGVSLFLLGLFVSFLVLSVFLVFTIVTLFGINFFSFFFSFSFSFF